jgi:DNA-binding beta-propeller fold protein YncE
MFGITHPVPVMVPYLNKLYVFSGSGSGDTVYAYDCLRDTVRSVFHLTDAVPCAVFDSRSNRVFFACEDAPTLRAIDPTTNSVVKTFELVGGSSDGRLALNPGLGRLYYTDQSPNRMFTIDLLTDSVLASDSLPWDVDTMFLDQRLGKLFLCSRNVDSVLVFDCYQGAIVDTVYAGYRYAGLLDDRNDKLYLRSGAVADCRYDSVVTTLPPGTLNPRSMAWDALDNRVFQATTSRLYVYRDDLTGVADKPVGTRTQRLPTIIRGVLYLPDAVGGERSAVSAHLLDISGRKVLDLKPGPNDVRALAPGVYFCLQTAGSASSAEPSAVGRQPSAVTKVVIAR